MVNIGEFLENLKLAVLQCYQTDQFYWTKLVENAKIENSIATYWAIFNHYVNILCSVFFLMHQWN